MTGSFSRLVISFATAGALTAACSSGNKRPAAPAPISGPNVTAADIESSGDPVKALQANTPGAIIRQTDDGGISVEIRGPSSFYGSSEPLYVVDGVPVQAERNGALRGLNPHDIAWIKVLKNPEDIAIYGVRGGNGVILIQTKAPGRHP